MKITRKMIEEGIKQEIITFSLNENLLVANIGEYWFYISSKYIENTSKALFDFLNSMSQTELISCIYETLHEFPILDSPEYDYYYCILDEKIENRSPYYLLIHTNSYTGNFERELIAYCFGILPSENKDYFEWEKAFWNYVSNFNSNTKKEYENDEIRKTCEETILLLNQVESMLSETTLKQEEKHDVLELYDVLNYTYQKVDDWKEDTFYNIESFYKNKEYNCDTIYVQLKEPLNDYLKDLIVKRINSFFSENAYKIIREYMSLCHYGEKTECTDEFKLLDLELVDKNYHLIEKFI